MEEHNIGDSGTADSNKWLKRVLGGMVALLSIAFLATPGQATPITFDGYTFISFDLPGSGSSAGTGTMANGIANNGAIVGFAIDNSGAFTNSIRNADGTFTSLSLSTTAMSFGIDSNGDVVGTDGSGHAFYLPSGGSPQTLTIPNGATSAFGINDNGNIVGQYTAGGQQPGFFLSGSGSSTFIKIDSPSGPDNVNAQGVNGGGLIVGYYIGTDGQDHGFMASVADASGGELAGSAIGDPSIPTVSGEPGATFVFSQILGINDSGIAVGYYGDSTTSQHGFLYDTTTGTYTFLDDPLAMFNNGVEVTQITGINNLGEITGFYSDSSGIFHGFVACPVGNSCPGPNSPTPEPTSWMLLGTGLAGLALLAKRGMLLVQS